MKPLAWQESAPPRWAPWRAADARLTLGYLVAAGATPALFEMITLRPAAGVAVAGAVLMGARAGPSVFLGSLLCDVAWALLTGTPLLFAGNLVASLGTAAGSAVAAVVSGQTLRWSLHGRDAIALPRDALRFCALGATTYALVSAAVGGAANRLWDVPLALVNWFATDLLGVIVVAPAILVWRDWRRAPAGPAGGLEMTAVTAVSLGATVLVSGPWPGSLGPALHLDTLFLVPLLWAAARCDQRLSVSLCAGCFTLICLYAGQGYGPLARLPGGQSGVIAPPAVLAVLGAILVLASALHNARERAVAALRDGEHRYRGIFENAVEGMFQSTPTGTFLTVNAALAHLLGYASAAELLAAIRDIPEQLWVDRRRRLEYTRRLDERGAVQRFECELRHKSGRGVWVSLNTRAVRAADGAMLDYEGAVEDISERRAGEEALRRSEASYRSLVEGAPFGIFRSTLEGRLLAVNPALVAMLGCDSEDELLGARGQDTCGVPELDAALIERLAGTGVLEDVEVRWRRKDETPITVRLNGRAVRHPAGDVESIEVIAEDITGRRRLEEELGQAQRMEAIGQLAGGVAHDFNNLLTVILGRSAMTLWHMGPDDPQRLDIELIRTAASRAAVLTRQLLTFSRKHEVQPIVLDLNAIVTEFESLLVRLLGEDIELITVLAPALWPIRADPSQVEQVIVNLAVNARDAMPHGGRLTIETANVEPGEEGGVRHPRAHAERYVRLTITDTGVGMDPETQARIFEPFFTTKETGKGTGLGLAIVYDVVRQGGGHIRVESAPGRGTRFQIDLPRVQAEPEGPALRTQEADPPRGSEVVLLAEDDRPLRKLVGEALASWGYTVLEAKDARDALTLSEQHAGGIDLLVTDVVMPLQSGRAVAAGLRSLRPGVRVLFMSGYVGGARPGGGVGGQSDFLQKPFTLEALARKVREVLGAGAPYCA